MPSGPRWFRETTKPPDASKSNTSAQGTHRAPTSTQGGKDKTIAEKLRKIAGNFEKLQKKIAKFCGPQSSYGDVWCAGQREQAHVSTTKSSSVVP